MRIQSWIQDGCLELRERNSQTKLNSFNFCALFLIFLMSGCVPTSRVSIPKVVEKDYMYFGYSVEGIYLPENLRNQDLLLNEMRLNVLPSSNISLGFGLFEKSELQLQAVGGFTTINYKYQLLDGTIPVTGSVGSNLSILSQFGNDKQPFFTSFMGDISVGYKQMYISPKVIYNMNIWDERYHYGVTVGISNKNWNNAKLWQSGVIVHAEYMLFKFDGGIYNSILFGMIFPVKWWNL